MVTILLTGIPGSGKTGMVKVTDEVMARYREESVKSISLADIVADDARRLLRTPKEKVPALGFHYQNVLRAGAIRKAALELSKIDRNEHVILDTPMSMWVEQGKIPNMIFSPEQVAEVSDVRSIDYVVTLIDDPAAISSHLRGTVYPREIGDILQWMSMEVFATENVCMGILEPGDGCHRHLVIPRNQSDETLAKLLIDPDPSLSYLVGPITHMQIKKGDSIDVRRKKLESLRRRSNFHKLMQQYAIVMIPIEMGTIDPESIESVHTTFRDTHWFVRNANFVIAYYPEDVYSAGTMHEMREGRESGKYVILIHPGKKREVFDAKPHLHFREEEEFFEAVKAAGRGRGKDERYEILRRFTHWQNPTIPRYADLRPYAVAVDIYDPVERKHLLIKQGDGKPFAGKLIVPTGKKNPGEKAKAAVMRETFEEVGVSLDEDKISTDYRIYPVDYAHTHTDGEKPMYVRFHRAEWRLENGVVHPNHATRKKEVTSAVWLPANKIKTMSSGDIVPATQRYFRDQYGAS